MAQPAGFAAQDNRTDMGIPVFWASANLDPPCQFKIWFEQFLMAVTVEEKVSPEVMLEDPKYILEEPPRQPETPREGDMKLRREPEILEISPQEIELCWKMRREEHGSQGLATIFIIMKYRRSLCPDYSSL